MTAQVRFGPGETETTASWAEEAATAARRQNSWRSCRTWTLWRCAAAASSLWRSPRTDRCTPGGRATTSGSAMALTSMFATRSSSIVYRVSSRRFYTCQVLHFSVILVFFIHHSKSNQSIFVQHVLYINCNPKCSNLKAINSGVKRYIPAAPRSSWSKMLNKKHLEQ